MLSYRHAFHAGNFADVHKHAVLSLLLQSLTRKDAPYCYLDTHSGAGRYDLRSYEAQKNGEYRQGIQRLWDHPTVPAALQPYLDAVRAINGDDGMLHYYPGSPRIARHFLRPQDRMILSELHPDDAQRLRQAFAQDRQVAVHHLNGYQGIKAFLPPKERRGLILMDPAFERREELRDMISALTIAARRWANGMYALWFPITHRAALTDFYGQLEKTGIRKILVSELWIRAPQTARQLNGSAMAVINPPWQLEKNLEECLPWLSTVLEEPSKGGQQVAWLVAE